MNCNFLMMLLRSLGGWWDREVGRKRSFAEQCWQILVYFSWIISLITAQDAENKRWIWYVEEGWRGRYNWNNWGRGREAEEGAAWEMVRYGKVNSYNALN
jgi:hypothetical protein